MVQVSRIVVKSPTYDDHLCQVRDAISAVKSATTPSSGFAAKEEYWGRVSDESKGNWTGREDDIEVSSRSASRMELRSKKMNEKKTLKNDAVVRWKTGK